MVGGSSRIPKCQEMLKAFFNGKELNHKVNPDEAVAWGATVQAAILLGLADDDDAGEIVLLDVTPLSLGTDIVGGEFSAIVARNSHIPI